MPNFDGNGGTAGPGPDPGKARCLSLMMEIDPDPLAPYMKLSAADLRRAAGLLQDRNVIVYPTETFYGLLAYAFDEKALERIAALKGRTSENPMPCLIGRREDLSKLASVIVPDQEVLMDRFWPGPLTLVFDAVAGLPGYLTGGTGTVGVRVPGHEQARSLAAKVGPLAATSANRSGEPAQMDPGTLRDLFPGVPVFDGGVLPPSKGSTVLDVRSRPVKAIRVGDIPLSAVEEVLHTPLVRGKV